MKRLFVSVFMTLFTLVLLALSPAQSQESSKSQNATRCNLNPAQSPAIRGALKLGMTTQELLSVFPSSNETNKNALDHSEGFPNFGVARLSFYAGDDARFAGIQSLQVSVFDGRVVEITVRYDEYPVGPQWRKVNDFVAKLSGTFRLPTVGDWANTGGSDYDSKTLTCSGWEIIAGVSPGPQAGFFTVLNSTYRDIVQERSAAYGETKRKEFKP